jgi:hypothetical protein
LRTCRGSVPPCVPFLNPLRVWRRLTKGMRRLRASLARRQLLCRSKTTFRVVPPAFSQGLVQDTGTGPSKGFLEASEAGISR